ncbi:MAG: LacI family DNA-binding transcriptional regulator [Rubrivivax sp.]|nr:LacI family DNA-binding transcriptional regulator [Rubrivivax sp.]
MANSITITQIAEAAGVSTATVDRVLNARPGVNPATIQKVQAAMQLLGAGVPARGRPPSSPNYRFGFVLPTERLGFADKVARVVAQAAGDFRHQHITEVTHRLPADNPADFAESLLRLTEFDGLAVMAPDVPAVKLAINDLVRAGVHVVTLFSDVPGSMRSAFVGADNRASGRTAALLLGRSLGPEPVSRTVGLFCTESRFAAEIDRQIGFTHGLQERRPSASLWSLTDLPADEDEVFEYVRQALARPELARLSAAYVVGAGSAGVLAALKAQAYDGQLTVAVHELLEAHRAMLVSGQVTYVLHQDLHYAVMTAARMLRALCESLRGAMAVSSPGVEIMTAENLA